MIIQRFYTELGADEYTLPFLVELPKYSSLQQIKIRVYPSTLDLPLTTTNLQGYFRSTIPLDSLAIAAVQNLVTGDISGTIGSEAEIQTAGDGGQARFMTSEQTGINFVTLEILNTGAASTAKFKNYLMSTNIADGGNAQIQTDQILYKRSHFNHDEMIIDTNYINYETATALKFLLSASASLKVKIDLSFIIAEKDDLVPYVIGTAAKSR